MLTVVVLAEVQWRYGTICLGILTYLNSYRSLVNNVIVEIKVETSWRLDISWTILTYTPLSCGLVNDVLVVVVAESPRQLLVVHLGLVLPAAPPSGHLYKDSVTRLFIPVNYVMRNNVDGRGKKNITYVSNNKEILPRVHCQVNSYINKYCTRGKCLTHRKFMILHVQ